MPLPLKSARLRSRLQMVFQSPYASLNPRMTVDTMLAEPLRYHRLTKSADATRRRIDELLGLVGLGSAAHGRYPHEFSGGQRQRISIARALAPQPDFIVADEPISALDVNIQAQIVNLMMDLRERLGLTYLFIAHDLAIVRHISDRIMVLYLGQVAEVAPADDLFTAPLHPYTRLPDFRAAGAAWPAERLAAAEADRRTCQCDQSAIRLPLPHALPDRKRHLCRATTAACACCDRDTKSPATSPASSIDRWLDGTCRTVPRFP